jgi:prepilin-type N-terminal cleavage/methylation domain-containing protein
MSDGRAPQLLKGIDVMKKKEGFTLIELLVVISIIALLLSIMMPSLQKVKQKAQRVVCMNNIKSQYIVQISYATSNDDKFPMHTDSSPEWVQTWRSPYDSDNSNNKYSQVYTAYSDGWVEEPKMFLCPRLRSLKGTPNGRMYTEIEGGSGLFTVWNDEHWTDGSWSYIGIPYLWFANYRHSGSITPGSRGAKPSFNFKSAILGKWSGFEVNEPAWPDRMSDCSGSKAFIAHNVIYTDSYGDYSHGGKGYSLDDSVDFDEYMGSEDNPVGYADGHVTWTKKSKMQPRASTGYWEVIY